MATEQLVDAVVKLLATMVLLSNVFIILALLSKPLKIEKYFQGFWENAVPLAFFVALVSTLGSLFLSEIAGWVPCKLCWFQRVFMYPLVILLGLAWWKKMKNVKPYAITLAALGLPIAAYHYGLHRFFFTGFIPCSEGHTCNIVFVFQYGYITIPFMALTGFVLVLLLLWKAKK